MCNTEITGQACIAKAGAFSGPTWLATEWMNAKPEVNMNVIRIIPTTSRWVAVKELKLYIKNAEGNVQEKIFDLGLNRIHNCETLIIKTQDKMIVTDMEMFVRGEADNIDIGTEIAE